ncbi:hypothetical protein RQP53_18085 [Paucibacter sp. APW11]|uniref:Uncharacterized protein n=1 Tax=Roseateles aquae TaxID=3077235 RepID=A0ABU3PF85_9BURK|nr:hypothetical protein [Paucibacter sp. APW11]MDT9001193.1 hypothetical protein [Paucibacter sp. APW11]
MSQNHEGSSVAPSLKQKVQRRLATVAAIRTRTMIVAVCALGTSLWQGYTIQKHNRLMVQPILDSEINTELDGAWSSFVLNSGLGPAKATRAEFYADGKPVSDLNEMLRALGEQPGCYGTGNLVHFYRVNSRQQVLRSIDGRCAKSSEELVKLLKRMRIVLHYESLYGEPATLQIFGKD